MGNYKKTLEKLLRGTSDANIAFDDLRSLLLKLGFSERIQGGHHIYRKAGIEEKINNAMATRPNPTRSSR